MYIEGYASVNTQKNNNFLYLFQIETITLEILTL